MSRAANAPHPCGCSAAPRPQEPAAPSQSATEISPPAVDSLLAALPVVWHAPDPEDAVLGTHVERALGGLPLHLSLCTIRC